METFNSRKRYDGFSTVFRQWKAVDTHCSKLHGYGIYFDVTFEGDLDHRNWVADFGLLKRAKTQIDGMNAKAWMDYMFDHTTIIAEDDPYIDHFKQMNLDGIIQLRVLPAVGAEQFAKFIYDKINAFVQEETGGRVKVARVDVYEHEKNSASYKP